MSNNWLQNYFLNRESVQDSANPYAWTTEVSTFERKPQIASGTYLKKTANIQVITRADIEQALRRQDAENYLNKIVVMFNRRECDFDPSIDISKVIQSRMGGSPWIKSFNDYFSAGGSSNSMSSNPHPLVQDDCVFFEQEVQTPEIAIIANRKSRLKKKS